MTQRIIVLTLAHGSGNRLLGDAVQMLAENTFREHVESLIEKHRVLYFSEHLDTCSTADSFERLLRPKPQVSFLEHGHEQLYAICHRKLAMRLPPRNREERLLRELLQTARSFGAAVDPEGWIFVWRKVTGMSRDPMGR